MCPLDAAQYLELHPNATATEVRRALTEQFATRDVILGAGSASPNKLLHTVKAAGQSQEPANNTISGGSNGFGGGVIVGIAVACAGK
jgi:hypothetical protein